MAKITAKELARKMLINRVKLSNSEWDAKHPGKKETKYKVEKKKADKFGFRVN